MTSKYEETEHDDDWRATEKAEKLRQAWTKSPQNPPGIPFLEFGERKDIATNVACLGRFDALDWIQDDPTAPEYVKNSPRSYTGIDYCVVDIDFKDAKDATHQLCFVVNPGDADANTGFWGAVFTRGDTKLKCVARLRSVGDCQTALRLTDPCPLELSSYSSEEVSLTKTDYNLDHCNAPIEKLLLLAWSIIHDTTSEGYKDDERWNPPPPPIANTLFELYDQEDANGRSICMKQNLTLESVQQVLEARWAKDGQEGVVDAFTNLPQPCRDKDGKPLPRYVGFTAAHEVFYCTQNTEWDEDYEEDPPELEILRYMLEQWPEAARSNGASQGLLLHTTCEQGHRRKKVVQFLVEQYPESIRLAQPDTGELPIHKAASAYSLIGQDTPDPLVLMETIKYLVELYPESLGVKRKDGKLPVEVAEEFDRGNHSHPVPDLVKLYLKEHTPDEATIASTKKQKLTNN